jgi:hypothetical protein
MADNNNEVKIEDSNVGGNLAGRDYTDKSISVVNNYQSRSTYLEDLYNRYEKEKVSNSEFRELCEELDYLNSVIDNDVIGLEKKFGRPDKYFVGLDNLNSYYLKNNLVVKFKSKDTTNMNNGLQNISIQKLDKKIML